MKLHVQTIKHRLKFTFKAGTSRGVMTERDTYYILIRHEPSGVMGIGESCPLLGLSEDDRPDFEASLQQWVSKIEKVPPPPDLEDIASWLQEHIPANLPSVRFGLETAWRDYLLGGERRIFEVDTHTPIPINGLVWMGDRDFMLHQIQEKLAQGFRCIKLKIGAIDFATELSLLAHIRSRFSSDDVTLRVDANGAFHPNEAMDKLRELSLYDLHSIEQPIAPHQRQQLRNLCALSPVPIALDEELIGVHGSEDRDRLLDSIRPQYLVLKPTLLGGLSASEEWIRLAESRGIGWWMTSALESNIGLNAIAQFALDQQVSQPQGLGTGQLYHNNLPSPIKIKNGYLHYDATASWDLSLLKL